MNDNNDLNNLEQQNFPPTNVTAIDAPLRRKKREQTEALSRSRGIRYPDREKEAIMAMLQLHGGNVHELVRVNPALRPLQRSIYRWQQEGIKATGETAKEIAARLDSIVFQCLDLLPEKLPEASVREIVGAMSQSIEKGLLLRGQPTNITAHADLRARVAEVLGVTIDVLPE